MCTFVHELDIKRSSRYGAIQVSECTLSIFAICSTGISFLLGVTFLFYLF